MAAQHGRPAQDLYQVLGVTREASGGEITRAWRRRALAEHPDARPGEADAPARFRAVAEAYQALGDPARRAAYDRVLEDQPATRCAAPSRLAPRPARPASGRSAGGRGRAAAAGRAGPGGSPGKVPCQGYLRGGR